ncbi:MULTISPECIES: SRPBCC family protein [Actinomadura]|uniref:SRPBCC family protein n=1 Tax=Actinomadura TaxID=1988 RepID=UPI0003AD6670|nr:SRPBCC domain-containing protein [Actinomadura madurae]MCP9950370.1 SRPBCC domain-containing protein [Actinomadura madurae]MCP9979618.1 SRPBCC domain-containing protein [Actinomadura madurae]MCQ0008855.1 SRPBCC domain-containing protein [Actinomadura madurae]MCQ0015828.1 SRPBCC domain-containing protein [Actinomadura madurae]URM95924.1 SRPBCC domain-containing protein [Actinomadura madurae]
MTPARERASIEVDEFLPHPPEKVWRALSEPGLLARWLMPNDFEPVVGHRFTFAAKPIPSVGFDGRIACEVLAVEEHRLLRISWHGGGLDTTVTWRLAPEGHGTRLFIEHAGFDLDDPVNAYAFRGMGSGWRSDVLRSLRTTLSTLT